MSDAPGEYLQVRPKSGASVWIADATGTHVVRIKATGASFEAASASNVSLAGKDLAESVRDIGKSPGVGSSNVLGIHVATIDTSKLGGVIGPGKGGTGISTSSPGHALVVSSDGTLRGVPGVRPVQGGIELQADVSVAGTVVIGGDGTISGRRIPDLYKGAPPSVSASAVSDGGEFVEWNASDRDGDLRVVAVRYRHDAGGSYTATEVRDLPDDWYLVDEGAYEGVFVKPASAPLSPPYFEFFRDKAGLAPYAAGSFRLRKGGKYRFELAAGASDEHPFWIGDSATQAFTGFSVSGSQGRSHSAGGLIGSGSNDFLQFSIPRTFSGQVHYFCTRHSSMRTEFRISGATLESRGDPVASVSGRFAVSEALPGVISACVVAEDAAGNLSEPALVSLA